MKPVDDDMYTCLGGKGRYKESYEDWYAFLLPDGKPVIGVNGEYDLVLDAESADKLSRLLEESRKRQDPDKGD